MSSNTPVSDFSLSTQSQVTRPSPCGQQQNYAITSASQTPDVRGSVSSCDPLANYMASPSLSQIYSVGRYTPRTGPHSGTYSQNNSHIVSSGFDSRSRPVHNSRSLTTDITYIPGSNSGMFCRNGTDILVNSGQASGANFSHSLYAATGTAVSTDPTNTGVSMSAGAHLVSSTSPVMSTMPVNSPVYPVVSQPPHFYPPVQSGTAPATPALLNSGMGMVHNTPYGQVHVMSPYMVAPTPNFPVMPPGQLQQTPGGTGDVQQTPGSIVDVQQTSRGTASAHNGSGCAIKIDKLKFNGKTKWKSFFECFQVAKNFYKWSDDVAASQLFACMTGEALDFAVDLDKKVKSDYPDLVQALRQAYDIPDKLQEVGLRSACRATEESIEAFGRRVKSLACAVCVNSPEEAERAATYQFLNGCGYPEDAREVLISGPKCLAEAVTSLKLRVSSRQFYQRRGGSPSAHVRNFRAESRSPDKFRKPSPRGMPSESRRYDQEYSPGRSSKNNDWRKNTQSNSQYSDWRNTSRDSNRRTTSPSESDRNWRSSQNRPVSPVSDREKVMQRDLESLKGDLAELRGLKGEMANLTTMLSQMSGRQSDADSSNSRQSRSPQRQGSKHCFRCNSPDHFVRDCKEPKPSLSPVRTTAASHTSPKKVHFDRESPATSGGDLPN